MLRRLVRNSKDYIKGVILSLIKKYGKIPALQLRDMVVEEQSLCSRSSFYRLLDELEAADMVGVVASGREKVYLAKAVEQVGV